MNRMANTKTFEQLSAEYEKNQDKEATVLCFDSLGRPIPPRGEGGRFKPKSLDNWTVERDSASGKTIMVDGRPAMLKRDDNSSWDKKDGSSFHWRDATKVLKDLQSVNTKASWTQDRARFDFSNRTSPLLVLPISDWHFGSLGSDYALIEEFTDLILNTPDLYIGIAGDMQQMAIKMRGVLEVSDNALSPKMQNRFLESWLSDIESKVLWSTWDNHAQERQENATGFSTYADLFSRKVVHFNGIGHMEIVVGSETYRIATSHKFRGGRTESNSLNGLMKYLRLTAPYMEMAIGGDTHVFGYAQYPEGGEIKTVLNCGTLQTNSGYAKRNCTLTTFPEFPCFMLRHDKHKIIMFPSIEDMMQCNGLRLAE